jgi:hypothetical protein
MARKRPPIDPDFLVDSPVETPVTQETVEIPVQDLDSAEPPKRKRRTKAEMAAAKATEAPRPIVDIPPEVTNGLYDVLGRLEAWSFNALLKVPQSHQGIVSEICLYTDEEKAVLAGPTGKVLGKYLPVGVSKYQDELALGLMLYGLHMSKWEKIKMAMDAPWDTKEVR